MRGTPDAATYRIIDAFGGGGAIDDAGVADVVAALAARSGAEREAFRMPVAELARIIDAFGGGPEEPRRELTLHAGSVREIEDATVSAEAARWRCRFLGAGEGWVVTENERDRESNATPLVEHLTGMPATSRGLRTVAGLVDRFGD
ncbi:hypothetical protein [Microbacterium lushaniae]|uniref:Uncharacterized protein n=1 Tax=Microbacterium lushaniae TaxID=2614639 RepID=A0A5J6L1J7_9MICO|nr:hypothetical protein [Microbacterium lushaniae]QEW02304.1 hypothetical protein F6J85_03805 [Microbacterium lushaniae]